MKWQPRFRMLRALSVGHEGLADVVEPDLFAIAEIVNRWIVTAPLPDPVTKKEAKVGHCFMQRRTRLCGVGHGAMLPPVETSVSHRTQR